MSIIVIIILGWCDHVIGRPREGRKLFLGIAHMLKHQLSVPHNLKPGKSPAEEVLLQFKAAL